MNARAFVAPPVYREEQDKHIVEFETYNWCGHPKYGTSYNIIEFSEKREALMYLFNLGYTPAY